MDVDKRTRDDIRAVFGRNVRQARERRGIGQEELARQCGVSRLTVLRIENGQNSPSIEVAAVIARALDESIDDLLRVPIPLAG